MNIKFKEHLYNAFWGGHAQGMHESDEYWEGVTRGSDVMRRIDVEGYEKWKEGYLEEQENKRNEN